MEIINADSGWFLSKEGENAFSALQSLEDRAIFVYSYLKTKVHEGYEQDSSLMKAAFFIVDALYTSNLPYATYPAVISEDKNPFVSYLVKQDKYPGQSRIYYAFLSILHGIADPKRHDEWIYDEELFSSGEVKQKLKDLGHDFYVNSSLDMADPAAFEIEDDLKLIQMKIVWLFHTA